MTAARHDFVHPVQPAAPVGEWPVAPRFLVLPAPAAAAPLQPVPPHAADLPAIPDVQAHVEAETLALAASPVAVEPESEPVAAVEPEPVAAVEPESEPVAVVVEPTVEAEAQPVAEPEATLLTPSPSTGRIIDAAVAPTDTPVAVTPMPNPPVAPATTPEIEAEAAAPATPVLPEALADASPLPHPMPEAPAAPVMPEPPAAAVMPEPPAVPTMPEPPTMPEAPAMPVPAMSVVAPAPEPTQQPAAQPTLPTASAAPATDAPIPLPAPQADWSAHVAPWPLDVVADLLPEDAGNGGRRTPQLPAPSRNVLLVGLLASAAGFVAINGLTGGDEPVVATPAAQTAATDWAAKVPKVLPKGDVDALTLDQRELRPARTKHQLELAMLAMKPGEVIRELTIRTDGTVMLAVVHGATQRNIVTKGMAPAAPALPATAGTPEPVLAIDPIEIDARIPRKLLRAVERAKGTAPSTIKMVRNASTRGGQATWVMQWADATGRPTTALFATPDGHKIASTPAGL